MRKIFSFIMLCLLAFNWFGYRLVMDCMQQHNDIKLEAKLDNNNYDEAQLVELKVPLHMAYQTSQSNYERFDGAINYKGVDYKYVKRKVANDTLYLQCIPNTGKAQMEVAKNDFYKNTNDLSANKGKQDPAKSTTAKKALSDYDNYLFSFEAATIVDMATPALNLHKQVTYSNPFLDYCGQPPC